MKNSPRIVSAFIILLISVLACNVPAPEQVLPPSDVQTSAALTIQAILTPTITSTVQQVIFTNTPTATSAPTGTITPTYSIPMLTLREQTNCRTGPGQTYDILFSYVKGVKREIIGYYAETNFWLVKAPESKTGECWLWGEYADISGSYWMVPSVTPPPTATIPPPKAPSVKWDYYCSYATNQIDVKLNWSDIAKNEAGYRVIRNGQAIAELPTDSTTFSESIVLVPGEETTYQIEVYNATSSTISNPISFTC